MKALLFSHALWGLGHQKTLQLLGNALKSHFEVSELFFVSEKPDYEPLIEKIYHHDYDLFIVEALPFSKPWQAKALIPLLQFFKNKGGLLLSSSKGMAGGWNGGAVEELSAPLLEAASYFDKMLVHADPTLFRLEETVKLPPAILRKLYYTGFIVNLEKEERLVRGKRVVVTAGSGVSGEELFKKTVDLASHFPDWEFIFTVGPLQPQTTAPIPKNLSLVPLVSAFNQLLQSAACAITQGGSTLLNLFYTNTPALVLPVERSTEQRWYAERFEERGLIRVLDDAADLNEEMRKMIASPPPPSAPLDFGGTKKSVELIQKWMRNG